MSENAFIFDTPPYREARDARLRCLFAYVPPDTFRGCRVLEMGSGTGEIGSVLITKGATVVSVDSIAEYVDELHRRYPDREAHVVDLETWDGNGLGTFDSVLCFGLLYHIAKPVNVLEACRRVAPKLYLETVVCDKFEAVCPLVTEKGPDQASSGTGCRPSPAWIESNLRSMDYEVADISDPIGNWHGAPDSVFDWRPLNDWSWLRDNHLLRKMYVATRNV
jgi:SAM-dependent methyltransferase